MITMNFNLNSTYLVIPKAKLPSLTGDFKDKVTVDESAREQKTTILGPLILRLGSVLCLSIFRVVCLFIVFRSILASLASLSVRRSDGPSVGQPLRPFPLLLTIFPATKHRCQSRLINCILKSLCEDLSVRWSVSFFLS